MGSEHSGNLSVDSPPPTSAANSWAGVRTSLAAAILGRPAPPDALLIAVRLLLIVLAHGAIAYLVILTSTAIAAATSGFWARAGFRSPEVRFESALPAIDPADAVLILPVSLLVIALEGAIAFIPFRVVARRERYPLTAFLGCWWRACRWGLILLPASACVTGALPQEFEAATERWAIVFLLAGPAWIAAADRRAKPGLSRWRPVCPECGYSLRRLRSDRCPECGVTFPTSSPVFRRWARRRPTWDRLSRGSLLVAYSKTMLAITFCPCRVTAGLAIPDRFGRAARWGVIHLLLMALAGVALGSYFYFWDWVHTQVARPVWLFGSEVPPASVVARWAAQSFGAWFAALALIPLLGMVLGIAIPSRHPAARRGIAKWSLYAVPLMILVAVVLYALALAGWLSSGGFSSFARSGYQGILLNWDPPTPPLSFLAIAYGIWWALGASANPFLRRRGFRPFVANVALFVMSWFVLTRLLFRLGALGSLL